MFFLQVLHRSHVLAKVFAEKIAFDFRQPHLSVFNITIELLLFASFLEFITFLNELKFQGLGGESRVELYTYYNLNIMY